MIKIIKSFLPTYWYANRIGQEFTIQEEFGKSKYLIKEHVEHEKIDYFVDKCDCEKIK